MIGALAFAACAVFAQADDAVRAAISQSRLVGEGRFDWFGLRVYEARLFSPVAFDAAALARQPFVLELTYRRELRGRDIARRSIEEMRRAPDFPESQAVAWEQAMTSFFPDVKAGDRIAGVNRPGAGASFFVNGRATGEIADPRFAALFFGIWLAPHTSEPKLRAALLGNAAK